MSVILEPAAGTDGFKLECKHCHHYISIQDTVAYHLIDGVLYGWCETCFGRRHEPARAELAA